VESQWNENDHSFLGDVMTGSITTAAPQPSTSPDRSSSARMIMVPLLAAAAACLVLLALTWPNLTAKPRNVPIAVAGQPQLVQRLGSAITRSAPGAIDVLPVADRAAAIQAVQTRDAVGAIVLQAPQIEVLTASAAGSGANEIMSQVANGLRTQLAGLTPTGRAPNIAVTDVVPLSSSDQSGARLMAATLPLAIGGILGGALLSVGLRRRGPLLVGLVGYALVTGFATGAILKFWYGALPGNYALTALAMSTALLAVASIVVALRRLIGYAGIGVGAALFILGSLPISGALVPREFLPTFFSDLGQYLPQGAAVTLLRDLSYFPDASTGSAWLVLGVWAAVGLLLTAVPVRRPQPRRIPAETTATTAPAR
jgi:hypothetical protein